MNKEMNEREEMALAIFKIRGFPEVEWHQFGIETIEKKKCLEAADVLIDFFNVLDGKA